MLWVRGLLACEREPEEPCEAALNGMPDERAKGFCWRRHVDKTCAEQSRTGRASCGCHRAILRGSWRRTGAFGTPGRARTLGFATSLSLLACGGRPRRRTTGVAKRVCATLKTECAFLESHEVTKVVALSNRGRSRSDISLLSETEGIATMQLVSSDSCGEAWRSTKRLLEESRETTTLIE